MRRMRRALPPLLLLAAGCASMTAPPPEPDAADVLKTSFRARGQAGLDRLDQDETQKLCSAAEPGTPVPAPMADRILKTNQAALRYPADGRLMGNWRDGERIAQTGVGKQFNDDPNRPAGGNCYACHELSRQELSFGTIGPSLHNFGKQRGTTPDTQRYVYARIFNPEAFSACSLMPRFGHNGILTEQQIKHLVALLLDPDSPVNK